MASIRKTKTASGATAVQVVRYAHDRIEVLKHIGSAHDDQGIEELFVRAKQWYQNNPGDDTLFPLEDQTPLVREGTEYLGALHLLAYSTLQGVAQLCKLDPLEDALFLDLAIIRWWNPPANYAP